jgi:hypothetical protein
LTLGIFFIKDYYERIQKSDTSKSATWCVRLALCIQQRSHILPGLWQHRCDRYRGCSQHGDHIIFSKQVLN